MRKEKLNKTVKVSFSWKRFLLGFHWIKPGGEVFWSLYLGPWTVRYDVSFPMDDDYPEEDHIHE